MGDPKIKLAQFLNLTPAPSIAEDPSQGTAADADILNASALAELEEALGWDSLSTMVAHFLKTAEKYCADLCKHADSGNLRDAKRCAHTLKGLYAQFGATPVAAVAEDIEINSKDVADINTLLSPLADSIARTRGALDRHFQKSSDLVS